MFEQLGMLGSAAVLIGGLIALNKGSDLTIENSVKAADATGFGKTTIGFILIAFCTTLPDLSVPLLSTIGQGTVGVAVGNVLGSNIVNICLILGLSFVLVGLKNSHNTKLPASIGLKRETFTQVFS